MTLILIIVSYILGSIPSALIIGKVFFNKDIRKLGSGNLGTTNTIRNLGKKAGFVVFALDFLKGFVSLAIANFYLGDVAYLSIFGAAAMIGHMFPIFAGFKGGKAVATGSSIFIYLYPYLAIVQILVFFIVLLLSGYVSLGSVTIASIGAIYTLINGEGIDKFVISFMCIFVIYMHRSNIIRIKNGTENISKLKIKF